MLDRLFPKQIDNNYRGHALALWLLGLFVALKLIMSTNSIFNTRSVAMSADGIPLDSFSAEAAETVLRLFSMLALGQLMLAILGIAALVRYRAMVPLLFVLLLIEQAGRRLIVLLDPADRASGTAPVGVYITLAILTILLIGLVLSLLDRSTARQR